MKISTILDHIDSGHLSNIPVLLCPLLVLCHIMILDEI